MVWFCARFCKLLDRSLTQSFAIVAKLLTNTNINLLKIAAGSSWDRKMTCLDGTRDEIINDLVKFASLPPRKTPDSSSPTLESPAFEASVRIQVVTGVLGCGKSAIAHSVAEICEKAGILGASFMFKRGIKDRESPDLLMSTIVRSLCAHWQDSAFSSAISQAIEEKPTIISPPISQQFQSLVVRPMEAISESLPRPVVIVIDALDEACDCESGTLLLQLLADDTAKLPLNIRVIITTRLTPEIERYLCGKPHIHVRPEIKLSEEGNVRDIAHFVHHSLHEIAERHPNDVDPEWPGAQALIDKAEGLFIWASTACNFVAIASDPADQLQQFIDAEAAPNLGLDKKMAQLYGTVLDACPWRTDRNFAKNYSLLMGTILALRTPLSPHAIKSILGLKLSITRTLRPLSPVLMGVTEASDGDKPLQILHDSFRAFLTGEDMNSVSAEDPRYKINVAEHNERLVLSVVQLLNGELLHLKPDLDGIISAIAEGESHGVPGPPDDITEALWYCCQYLSSHLSIVTEPSRQLIDALNEFMKTSVSPWIVLCSSKGSFPDISSVFKWYTVCIIHTFIGV